MLNETLERFRKSGKSLSSREIAQAYDDIKASLTNGIITSLAENRELREDCYFQIKALDAVMNRLISGWK